MAKTRYAIVGMGGRSQMYSEAILGDYRDRAELVGVCDLNTVRIDYWNRQFAQKYDAGPIPGYDADAFDRMVSERKPDYVIVTTIDRAHHTYIIRAMELGCDVITEKPMTIDAEKCRRVLDAIERTGRKLRVGFNYRYGPPCWRAREELMKGVIGEPLSADMLWLLDTRHGADYFRRWHRDKRNSGGLLVHKSTHHFDLMNWWLEARPKTVFCTGDLAFYGRANAEERGMKRFYDRGTGHPVAKDDPFALHLDEDEQLKGLYLDAESEDGYRRDQSVFGDGISIEDRIGVIVRYDNGVIFTYHLSAFSPWEGVRVGINGTKGRLEMFDYHRSYVSASLSNDLMDEPSMSSQITVFPHWEKPYPVEVPEVEGGHGGSDPVICDDIFGEPHEDPLGRAASHIDGAYSILVGIAANTSMQTGRPVEIKDLVTL